MNTETICLTLTTDYVADWGVWEALREFAQNCLDCNGIIDNKNTGIILFSNEGTLKKETLLLGATTKSSDTSSIGQYGEGYKLACLVLTRMGYKVTIRTGNETWHPSIAVHPQLGIECLAFNFVPCMATNDTTSITITGLTTEDDTIFDTKYIPKSVITEEYYLYRDLGKIQMFNFWDAYDTEQPEPNKDEPKAIYVNGLFVCNLPNTYHFSYNIVPELIKLDRDRNSISTWDFQYTLALELQDAMALDILTHLTMTKAPDLNNNYIPQRGHSYSGSLSNSSKLAEYALQTFKNKYGDNAFPINEDFSQDKIMLLIDQAKRQRLEPILVNKCTYDMLPGNSKQLPNLPPKVINIKEELITLVTQHKKYMNKKVYKALKLLLDRVTLM